MKFEVKLPELGDDAPDQATVSFWYVDEGEEVKEGDDLVELVTDKATFNMPSPATGKLLEVKATEGDEVKVGGLMAYIETSE